GLSLRCNVRPHLLLARCQPPRRAVVVGLERVIGLQVKGRPSVKHRDAVRAPDPGLPRILNKELLCPYQPERTYSLYRVRPLILSNQQVSAALDHQPPTCDPECFTRGSGRRRRWYAR